MTRGTITQSRTRQHLLTWLPMLLLTATPPMEAQEVAGRPTEEAVEALRFQWEAAFLGGAAVAKQSGQSIVEFGEALGRVFAPGWGQEVTAVGFAQGMASNFQLFGQDAEVTVRGDEAVVRWARLDRGVLEERNGYIGLSYAEYETLMGAVVSAIAAEHGLRWDETVDGSYRTARVTRR